MSLRVAVSFLCLVNIATVTSEEDYDRKDGVVHGKRIRNYKNLPNFQRTHPFFLFVNRTLKLEGKR